MRLVNDSDSYVKELTNKESAETETVHYVLEEKIPKHGWCTNKDYGHDKEAAQQDLEKRTLGRHKYWVNRVRVVCIRKRVELLLTSDVKLRKPQK